MELLICMHMIPLAVTFVKPKYRIQFMSTAAAIALCLAQNRKKFILEEHRHL